MTFNTSHTPTNPDLPAGHPRPTDRFSITKNKTLVPARSALIRFGFDGVALILAFFASSWGAHVLAIDLFGTTPLDPVYLEETHRYNVYASLSALLLFLFFSKGHYTNRIPWWTQVQFITSAVAFILIIDGFLSFALELYFSRLLIISNWIFAFGFLLASREIAYRVQKNKSFWQVPTVIIGDTSTVTDILYALKADRSTGYTPHTVFLRGRQTDTLDMEDIPARFRDVRVVEGTDDIEHYILSNPHQFYIISLDAFRGDKRDDVIRACHQSGARFAIIPTIAGMSLYDMEPRYFFGHDVMFLHAKTISSPIGKVGKRTMDVGLSAVGLLLLAPVFITIAAFLKLEGQKGSVFYGGQRLGKDGSVFKCWKFRSMEPESDHLLEDYFQKRPEMKVYWDRYHKLPDDPRIKTKTAAFIRKSSLDEIPQLWNVLKGDMSLVGPRPILPDELKDYGDTIDAYLKVKPGITGLWQVSGRNSVSFQRRIYWDNWYVRNWSLWGDIVIILKTIPAVINRAETS